ncbi:MAG TPA: exosortase K [Pyrinomonadaceae bacterium]|nr:exosortase K [Pyrinomonadaceae bacterium]
MNHKVNWNRLAQVVVVLLVALGLKQYYSTVSANQLRWILAPTTMLVSLVSGESFQFESYAGYITSDHTFVIAAACAGVNFLITAFLMLSLQKLWVGQAAQVSWRVIPTAAFVAYLATLVANAVRITIALQLQRTPPQIAGLSRGELHRFEGIFVYFGFLLLLFLISERGPTKNTSRALSLSVFPLLIYYLTTLGIPLANSAYRQRLVAGDFREHFVFVLLTPLIFIVPIAAFRYCRSHYHLATPVQNR